MSIHMYHVSNILCTHAPESHMTQYTSIILLYLCKFKAWKYIYTCTWSSVDVDQGWYGCTRFGVCFNVNEGESEVAHSLADGLWLVSIIFPMAATVAVGLSLPISSCLFDEQTLGSIDSALCFAFSSSKNGKLGGMRERLHIIGCKREECAWERQS